jgi:hypothetical protein
MHQYFITHLTDSPYGTYICIRGSFILFLISQLRLLLSSSVQMLKAIGVIKESKMGVEEPCQDSVTAPLDWEDKRDIDEKDDDWEDEDEEVSSSAILGKLLPVIGKVHAI